MNRLLPSLLLIALAAPTLHAQRFFGSSQFVVRDSPAPVYRANRVEEAMLRPISPRPEPPQAVSGEAGPTVRGNRAIVRRGVAYAPANAPEAVKRLIWGANRLRNMPYKWGGGHGSFRDSGYDCSGTVSFALHHAGVLSSPLSSRGFLGWGRRGRGEWVTVYARNGHTFIVVAGLRLDAQGMSSRQGPRWYADMRSTGGFTPRSHPAL